MRRMQFARVAAQLKAVAGGAAIAALFAAPVGILTWWINARGNALALPILAFDFWLSFFLLLLPAVGVVHLATRLFRRELRLRHDAAIGVAILFFLLWFVRMEPAHQMASFTPHFSIEGAIDLLGIAAATLLVLVAGITKSFRRALLCVVAVALMCAGLEALARAQAPPRHRDEAVARVGRVLTPPSAAAGPHSGRVLLIGLDGMEWRVVASLVEAGKLPAIAKLLRGGRYYQLDNHDMRLSPEIWTTMYTGVEARRSGIDGFVQWNFAGVREPIVELPKFGCHTILFIERLLWRFRLSFLWGARPVSNRDFAAPPVWTIASHAGRRMAVVEPMPLESSPERIPGAFVLWSERQMAVYYDGRRVDTRLRGIRRDTQARMLIQTERNHVAVAAPVIAAGRYDAAIYYTHFLDGIGHFDWEQVRSLDAAALERTAIGEGYIQADRSVAALVEAFGEPATVILVSDHGWEFNDYEHFLSPFGVLAISPAPEPGYGGKASVRRMAATFLALAGVAPGTNMEAPLPGVPQPLPAVDYSALVRRKFYPRVINEEETMKRLRALGYIGR